MPSITPDEHSAEDAAALIKRVAEIERTQRAEDVEGFLSLFEPDAVWVTGGGRRLLGLETIGEFTRQVLPGATRGGTATYEVVHIAFIRPDVAVTNVRQQYFDPEGKPSMPGAPSYVWSKTDGVWRIAAGQNTPVAET